MFLGGALLFVTTASINVSVMASVPPDNRSLAIGVSTIIMHVLGDVPSPPIIVSGSFLQQHDFFVVYSLLRLCCRVLWLMHYRQWRTT